MNTYPDTQGNNFDTLFDAMNSYNRALDRYTIGLTNDIAKELFLNYFKKYLHKIGIDTGFIRAINKDNINIVLEDGQCTGASISIYGYYGSQINSLERKFNRELAELDWSAITCDNFKTKSALTKFNSILSGVKSIQF